MAINNPLVAQGVLNRLRASVTIGQVPTLNVTAPYLGKDGIRLALDGEAVGYRETMTGAVTSPEPYQMATVTIHLLKSQQLADLYKQRMEVNALIGAITVRPDTNILGAYDIINCSIQSVRELNFSGADPEMAVVIRGYYLINDQLWTGEVNTLDPNNGFLGAAAI